MSTEIKIKRGSGTTPTLADGELGFNKSNKTLTIGTDQGNVDIGRPIKTISQNDYDALGTKDSNTIYIIESDDAVVTQSMLDNFTSNLNVGLLAYPVGSIYLSTNNTSPASLFGGTWEQLKDRFLLGAGDSYAAGSTGGEATHKLENAEMPRHGFHIVQNGDGIGTAGTGNAAGAYMNNYGIGSYGDLGRGWNPAGGEYYPAGHYEGGNQPHNNMPPYLAVYVWKRTA